jgi:hypothetical protein
MRLGQWLRRRTGPLDCFAQTHASGLVEVIEVLSASLVLFGGRRLTSSVAETDRTTFETHFEMEQAGFEPIEKDIAALTAPRIEEAQRAEPEFLRSAFRMASGFLCLYSQNCAHRYMKVDNAREFAHSLAASLCQRLAGRFGFNDDPQQVEKQIDDMFAQLCCDKFLDVEAFGRNDALGRLLNCLSLSANRKIQYGFMVGSMNQPIGCAAAVIRAAEAIDDSIKQCAQEMRW